MPITALYAALLAPLFLLLSVRVIRQRRGGSGVSARCPKACARILTTRLSATGTRKKNTARRRGAWNDCG
jgi:hypothetical protein